MKTVKKTEILIIDDEKYILEGIKALFYEEGFQSVVTCGDPREGKNFIKERNIGLVLLDLTMPYISGQEMLAFIREEYPAIPVIIITGINEVSTAVECMHLGASDYLVKAIDKTSLMAAVYRALKLVNLREENIRLKKSILSGRVENPDAFRDIITQNDSMEKLFLYLESIAPTASSLLITGETGTGKELLAEAFHKVSKVPGKLVKLNIAGLDDTMFSDTLFGHKRGAFSGALETRQGLIASAEEGTLFLDEIGDLQPQVQTKLLRLVENREYYRLGSDLPLKAKCNIITATNRSLLELSSSPAFRKDLYYRLSNYSVEIPPLKERRGDIPLLFDFFLLDACRSLNRPLPSMSRNLIKELERYSFPGNVRELKTLAIRTAEYSRGGQLFFSTWKEIPGIHLALSEKQEEIPMSFPHPLPGLNEMSEALIEEALKRSGGNITKAAGMLGISQPALSKRLGSGKKNLQGTDIKP